MAKAITMKGIVRSQSKLTVEDGCAEDLINLRFKDGSWRTSGEGKLTFTLQPWMGDYTQLYIHTCATYRHLLGVKTVGGVRYVYWFANINEAGTSVTPKTPAQQICKVADGDIYINQSGHLLTIIDGEDDFEYVVFKTGDEAYRVVNVDTNGEQNSRSLYPFGDIHFNYQLDNTTLYSEAFSHPREQSGTYNQNDGYYNALITTCAGKAIDANRFVGSFFAIAAIKLYDGSYAFASQPVFVNPRENINPLDGRSSNYLYWEDSETHVISKHTVPSSNKLLYYYNEPLSHFMGVTDYPAFGTREAYQAAAYPTVLAGAGSRNSNGRVDVLASDLLFHISNTNVLSNNSDIFSSICLFITNPCSVYDLNASSSETGHERQIEFSGSSAYMYNPHILSRSEYINKLISSPFYLLKEYSIYQLDLLINEPRVDLSGVSDKGIIRNITQQDMLTYESQSHLTYIPKCVHAYNGKLHIANYISKQFHGYPLESFMLQNCSLKYQQGSTYEGLQNLADNNNQYYQYTSNKLIYKTSASQNPPSGTIEKSIPSIFREEGLPLAMAICEIETGEDLPQVVCRYISAPSTGDVTLHQINSLLSFPDSRAKKITIMIYDGETIISGVTSYRYKKFEKQLKAHPYLNLSYNLDDNLRPIDITAQATTIYYSISELRSATNERYVTEQFPNGLKVSQTNNPFYFPVEQAYQVGNGTILAMCSNAIAVGTGQTGAAPLYVFCTDGIYAMYVDQSGEMAYTNARVIARDVLNNPKSVTPIDTGVVFTTDRGLMCIAGNEVQEIGQPAEGDVQQYNAQDWGVPQNIGKNMLTKVANLPNTIVDGVDFLQFLTGAIVNYNHNERELMISNPTKQNGTRVYNYTYVLDRDGNWSRRSYGADEYVNNYPTSYRFDNGSLYKVDSENGQLDGKSEADNKFLYLSNVIKLDTLDFKQTHRFILRGKFDTGGTSHIELDSDGYLVTDNFDSDNLLKLDDIDFSGGFMVLNDHKMLGCYVFGSYDGKRYSLIGANEKKGKFTDIGCLIERIDVKYLRIGLAGSLTGDSRIDYMEIDGQQSNLSRKIR